MNHMEDMHNKNIVWHLKLINHNNIHKQAIFLIHYNNTSK